MLAYLLSNSQKTITMKKVIILTIALGGILSSCRRDRDSDLTTSRDNALAESTFDEANDISDQAARGVLQLKTEEVGNLLSQCATVTHDTLSSPRTLTIDFGTSNCLCSDGKNRRGVVEVTYTGKYRDAGTVITITFDNYYVNDNKVEGTRIVTNNGLNNSGNISFSVEVDGTITKTNGEMITWTSSRTREWVAGYNTQMPADDEYRVTGTASGTNAAGLPYTVSTMTPLLRKVACRQFVSGTLKIIPSGKPERLIDYGNGDCDNEATVTINGNTFTINL